METNKQDMQILRAKISPSESAEYDFECVAVPSANGQLRYSHSNEEYFNQVLRTAPENINTERLESGLPLFDNHPWDNSAKETLGITVGYSFDDRGLVCRCKFGARADEALRADVKNGVIKTVSIEGEITNYSVKRDVGQVPVYYADLWTPYSLSFAPVPNDIGAQMDVKRAIEKQVTKEKPADKAAFESIINKF